MYTKNDWLQTNISHRLQQKDVDFKLIIKPYKFKPLSLNEASDLAVKEIASNYSNLYLALSGGADSEYALRAFHRNNIKIIPIIVVIETATEEENAYAFELCKELNLLPSVITITEEEFILYYNHLIFNRVGGIGLNSTPPMLISHILGRYVDNPTLITGDNFLGDGDILISDTQYLLSNEWDFYINSCEPNCKNIHFFLYSIEIMYSTMPGEDMRWDLFKHRLFNIKLRKKMKPTHNEKTLSVYHEILRSLKPCRHSIVLSKQTFLNIFEKYKTKT